jgi:hypothetical protein
VKNENARRFYETEALRGGWSVRQLERKINSQFYERTALSKNKAAMLKKGARAKPEDTLMVESVDSAIRQVAEKVLEKAKQTHTLMVIWEDDQIKEIPPEEMEMRLNARLSLEASSWPVLYVVTIFWIRVIR